MWFDELDHLSFLRTKNWHLQSVQVCVHIKCALFLFNFGLLPWSSTLIVAEQKIGNESKNYRWLEKLQIQRHQHK